MEQWTILVSTWSDGLFAVTRDWRTQEIEGQPVRGLVSDGRGGALAVVGPHSIWRRSPNGEWVTITTGKFELSCCMVVKKTVYVGTDDARMLRLSDEGSLDALVGFDHVAGRDTWFAGSAIVNGERVGPPLGIRSVATNSNGSVLFANVHVGGISRSVDGGATWQPTIDIRTDVHQVCTHPVDPEMVAAASAIGLCISRDGGTTWTVERDGLHATHCSAVAFLGDDILLSASTDPFAAEGGIYRRPAGPHGRIAPVEGGLPPWTDGAADTNCIATRGSMAVLVDRAGNLYLSTDSGRSWSRISSGLPMPSSALICG